MISKRSMLAERQSEEEFVLSQFSSSISVTTNDATELCPSLENDSGRSCSPDSFSSERQNAQSSIKATQEEAQLLMNLLSPVPNRSSVGWNPQSGPFSHSPIMSPVFSSNYNHQEEMARPLTMKNGTAFEFTSPSLSLAGSDFLGSSTSSNSNSSSSDSKDANSRTQSNHIVPPSPSLTRTSNQNINNKHSASTPMRISVKEQNQRELLHLPKLLDREITKTITKWEEVLPKAENLAENIQSTFEFIVDSRIQIWMESIKRVLRLREEAKILQKNNAAKGATIENKEGLPSREDNGKRKVLEALTRVSTNISVSKVQTFFRPLSPQQLQQRSHRSQYLTSTSSSDNAASPPPRKRSKLSIDHQSGDLNELEVPLEFIATIDVAPYDLTLTLSAPGTIKGFFLPLNNAQGKKEGDRLLGVELLLDVEAFVKSLRRKSRYVARKAAESELFSPTHVAAVAPYHNNASCNKSTSAASQQEEASSTAMPPPPPRNSKLMGIVSPLPGSPDHRQLSSSQSSTSDNHSKESNNLPDSLMAPFAKDTEPKVSSSSSSSSEDKIKNHLDTNTSLPALMEVARASFAAEKRSMMTSS